MMKLRLSLRNSARASLNLLIIAILSGCTSSTSPSFQKTSIAFSVKNICKNEYNIDAICRLTGNTLWVYVPLENIVTKAEKPEKFTEKFQILENKSTPKGYQISIEYLIKKVPEKEQSQDVTLDKKAAEKMYQVRNVIRRVLFSMQKNPGSEPEFICMIIADIKYGFAIKELTYYQDLKKVSYSLMSVTEYQHRIIQETEISPDFIDNTTGDKIDYKEITMPEFIARQIEYRIKLKFQKPEVDYNAETDKEILNIASSTIRAYGFKDFREFEFRNLLTKNTLILNNAAVWEKSSD
ncbi:MAG: hypothetical protein KJ880_02575 [Candidatus Omnitrophica bacterium]|nr:hypothetical protein [Candidatus Omnitrophota bacterium]